MDTPRRSSRFRPCIDLHHGQVKQIVGGTLSESDPNSLKTNFVARSVKSKSLTLVDIYLRSVNLLRIMQLFTKNTTSEEATL